MLPAATDDGAAIFAAKARLHRGDITPRAIEAVDEERHRSAARNACRFAPYLERILIELVERRPDRKAGIEIVVDELDGKAIVGRGVQRAEKIDRLGIVPAVLDEAVTPRVAGKQRVLEIADLLARSQVVGEIAEAAAIDAIFDAIDGAARAGAEIERAAGRVIAVERRRRTPDDVDRAIGARIDQVAAGKPVRLRHREPVLEDHDIADRKAVSGVGAADRDADIAGSVALLHRYAGALAQHVGHGNRRPVVELAAIDGRLRLAGWRLVKQRPRHARGDARRLRDRRRGICRRRPRLLRPG